MRTRAAAPSDSCDALPAVIVPLPENAGESAASPAGDVPGRMPSSSTLEVDRVVLATGYRTDLRRVPYLAPAMDRIELDDGFPGLDESFQSTLPGLYIPGFASTKDFGPFFGFTKGCPAAAAIIARHLARVGRGEAGRTVQRSPVRSLSPRPMS
jgi:hypothetical protein